MLGGDADVGVTGPRATTGRGGQERRRRMPRLGRTLAARILLAVLGIVVVTLAVGFALFARLTSQTADAHAIEQASGIAVTLGRVPQVAREVVDGDPSHVLPALGSQVRASTGASYVVIIDRTGLRYSHPNPALIGQRIEEPVVALDGQVHTGILESEVGVRLNAQVLDIALYAAIALALGVAASLLLARAIKRVTFGVEPAEIVALVQEREAMLHGIREGVLGIDGDGAINVLNDEARRLLGLDAARLGQRVEDLVPPGRLRGIVTGEVQGTDLV